MITQRRIDELQVAASARAEELFEKWLAQFLGKRAEREEESEFIEEPEEEVEYAETSD